MDVLQLKQCLDSAQIRQVVDLFYERIWQEPLLGPIFAATVEAASWPTHQERIQAFWIRTLIGQGEHLGDPIAPHRGLGSRGADERHLERWLQLWQETAHEVLGDEIGAALAQRARRMARPIQQAMARPAED